MKSERTPSTSALALRRFLLPWAEQSTKPTELVDNRDLPELEGGNWLRGEKEFFGTTANCAKCHTMRGVGGKIGPDLSNLPQRDYASVLRDVTQPSFAINPDYVSQTVLLADGRALAGTTRVDGDNLIVADQEGKETVVPRADVEELAHSPQSIMPEGLPKALGEERLRDLMTFLLVEPPHMPVYGELPPPPPRRMADVEAVLAGAEKLDSPRPLQVVLVGGAKDHGPGEHDYPAWKVMWRQLLELADGVQVTTAENWPSADQFKSADAIVFFQKGEWTPERARDLDAFLARGGGVSYIHYAVDGGNDAPGFAERIGLAWMGGRSKFRHGPLDVNFAAGKEHPIGRNFDQVHFYDESYWQPYGDPGRINLLATCVEEGRRAAAVLDARTWRRAGVRLDPGALLVDVRRSAVSDSAAARVGVDGEGAGRSVQRTRAAGARGRRLRRRVAAGQRPAGAAPRTVCKLKWMAARTEQKTPTRFSPRLLCLLCGDALHRRSGGSLSRGYAFASFGSLLSGSVTFLPVLADL